MECSIALLANRTFYSTSRDQNQPITRSEFNKVLYKIKYFMLCKCCCHELIVGYLVLQHMGRCSPKYQQFVCIYVCICRLTTERETTVNKRRDQDSLTVQFLPLPMKPN